MNERTNEFFFYVNRRYIYRRSSSVISTVMDQNGAVLGGGSWAWAPNTTLTYGRAGSVSVFVVGIGIRYFRRYFFMSVRYSVFFGIWNTDFGIGIGILKYLGIRYGYRLPTQD